MLQYPVKNLEVWKHLAGPYDLRLTIFANGQSEKKMQETGKVGYAGSTGHQRGEA